MAEKVYVGRGKEITTQYGSMININLSHKDLVVNEKGYCNLTISKMKQADKWGNTHSVSINDYKPKQSMGNKSDLSISDLPF
jgi:hypothetical protein